MFIIFIPVMRFFKMDGVNNCTYEKLVVLNNAECFFLFILQLYVWWIDGRNYCELTRPWYAKVLRLPLNYFLPGHQQRAAQETIDNLWSSDLIEDNQKETAVRSHFFLYL